jgi:hypothetical protein
MKRCFFILVNSRMIRCDNFNSSPLFKIVRCFNTSTSTADIEN